MHSNEDSGSSLANSSVSFTLLDFLVKTSSLVGSLGWERVLSRSEQGRARKRSGWFSEGPGLSQGVWEARADCLFIRFYFVFFSFCRDFSNFKKKNVNYYFFFCF